MGANVIARTLITWLFLNPYVLANLCWAPCYGTCPASTIISYTGQLYTHEGVSYLRNPILAMTVAQVPLPVLRPQLPPNRRGIVYFTTVANLSLAN